MRAAQVIVTVPVTVSARRVDEAEAEQVGKEREAAIAAAQVERLLAKLDPQIAEATSEWATNDQLEGSGRSGLR